MSGQQSVVEWEWEQEGVIKQLAALHGWSMTGPEVADRRKGVQVEAKWRQKAAMKALKKAASSPVKARLSGVKAEGGKREEPLKWLPSVLMAADCETAGVIKFPEKADFGMAKAAYPHGPWFSDRR